MVVASASQHATPTAQEPPANTMTVQEGELSSMVTLGGTLTYRGRPDGSPYSAINQARGIYTKLPESGDKVGCGDVLYRVDERPVLLLCGTAPAYRDLKPGDAGRDVRQLNRNLRRLGYDAGGHVFTPKTKTALEKLQRRRSAAVTGALRVGDAVFLPRPVRIAKVTGELGAPAAPGAPVAQATTDTLAVQVDLDPSQQGEVKAGDRAQITLPGNRSVMGKVERVGRVAQIPDRQDAGAQDATIPASIGLDDSETARGLDQAPVQVDVTTEGVKRALSVPVTALVGKSGGGMAVEVVRDGGRRELVAVQLGLFDTAGGRVQVEGDLRAGERVAVSSS
jgi:peptidoglycan hydrolase-like protein with peptidoglycan-binding domain